MVNERISRSLTAKMMAVVLGALILAILVGMGSYFTGAALVRRFYFSEAAVERRMTEEMRSFREYVAEHSVTSTDVVAVEQWNRQHRYTQLTIQGLGSAISSNYLGAELIGSESGLMVRYGQAASEGMEFAVNFADGSRSVMIYESSESLILGATAFAAVLSGMAVFLAAVLLYERQLTQSIVTLSRQITHVSREDTDTAIVTDRVDELGQLAVDVENMRLSIIERLRREEAAWQANTQLITAISHDVRTPLTAMMGYLDLLEDESLSVQERQAFLQVCRSNARRLKGLTDELFGFFLVFGKPEPDMKPERLDAAMLFEQLLLEYEAQLKQQGFEVRTVRRELPQGQVEVDVGHIRRVFDNLCSNLRKYADPLQPVGFLLDAGEKELSLTVSNTIAPCTNRVERNGIGLQTCRKLLTAMSGTLHLEQTDRHFSAQITLPLHPQA